MADTTVSEQVTWLAMKHLEEHRSVETHGFPWADLLGSVVAGDPDHPPRPLIDDVLYHPDRQSPAVADAVTGNPATVETFVVHGGAYVAGYAQQKTFQARRDVAWEHLKLEFAREMASVAVTKILPSVFRPFIEGITGGSGYADDTIAAAVSGEMPVPTFVPGDGEDKHGYGPDAVKVIEAGAPKIATPTVRFVMGDKCFTTQYACPANSTKKSAAFMTVLLGATHAPGPPVLSMMKDGHFANCDEQDAEDLESAAYAASSLGKLGVHGHYTTDAARRRTNHAIDRLTGRPIRVVGASLRVAIVYDTGCGVAMARRALVIAMLAATPWRAPPVAGVPLDDILKAIRDVCGGSPFTNLKETVARNRATPNWYRAWHVTRAVCKTVITPHPSMSGPSAAVFKTLTDALPHEWFTSDPVGRRKGHETAHTIESLHRLAATGFTVAFTGGLASFATGLARADTVDIVNHLLDTAAAGFGLGAPMAVIRERLTATPGWSFNIERSFGYIGAIQTIIDHWLWNRLSVATRAVLVGLRGAPLPAFFQLAGAVHAAVGTTWASEIWGRVASLAETSEQMQAAGGHPIFIAITTAAVALGICDESSYSMHIEAPPHRSSKTNWATVYYRPGPAPSSGARELIFATIEPDISLDIVDDLDKPSPPHHPECIPSGFVRCDWEGKIYIAPSVRTSELVCYAMLKMPPGVADDVWPADLPGSVMSQYLPSMIDVTVASLPPLPPSTQHGRPSFWPSIPASMIAGTAGEPPYEPMYVPVPGEGIEWTRNTDSGVSISWVATDAPSNEAVVLTVYPIPVVDNAGGAYVVPVYVGFKKPNCAYIWTGEPIAFATLAPPVDVAALLKRGFTLPCTTRRGRLAIDAPEETARRAVKRRRQSRLADAIDDPAVQKVLTVAAASPTISDCKLSTFFAAGCADPITTLEKVATVAGLSEDVVDGVQAATIATRELLVGMGFVALARAALRKRCDPNRLRGIETAIANQTLVGRNSQLQRRITALNADAAAAFAAAERHATEPLELLSLALEGPSPTPAETAAILARATSSATARGGAMADEMFLSAAARDVENVKAFSRAAPAR